MSEEKEKFSFFKSIKKSLLNSENEKAEDLHVEDTENVLREITITTVQPTENKDEVTIYKSVSDSKFIDVKFAENFVSSNGKFIYCEDEKEFFNFLNSLKKEKNWNHLYSWNPELLAFFNKNNFQTTDIGFILDNSDVAASFCYNIAANEGVIVLTPEQSTNRKLLNFPKTHVVIAYKTQLKEDVYDAIKNFNKLYPERLPSLLELHKGKPVSKQNRKILLNADGPEDVYLFYIDSDKIV